MLTILDRAQLYVKSGLSVIPIVADGSKKPAVKWEPFQKRIAGPGELRRWFTGTPYGVGVVCGAVSGGLLVIDLDRKDVLTPWLAAVRRALPDFPGQAPLVSTPAGWHVYLRTHDVCPRGRVLARDAGGAVLIETRGEGQYVLAPGCPPACHPLGALYQRVRWEDAL